MFEKYIKPKSMTWWASVAPLSAGVFLATLPFHGQITAAQVVSDMFGGATAATLINIGLGGIGLRGAMG